MKKRLQLPQFLTRPHIVMVLVVLAAFAGHQAAGEWFILRWIEKPAKNGPSKTAAPTDRAHFVHNMSFDHRKDGDEDWARVRGRLREGDVIAYKMDKWEARKKIVKGNLNTIGYRLLKYGHLAIVAADDDGLQLFSSHSFVGPNVSESVDTLKTHSWDCYRLDKWKRIDQKRFHDFIRVARQRGEAWYGYDFSGMFGLWNSNLKPSEPEKVGHDYICSTVVVAALYYAGLELDAVQRGGIADIVTPKQVVSSAGHFIPLPDVRIEFESNEDRQNVAKQ